jgi:hypothetical protein
MNRNPFMSRYTRFCLRLAAASWLVALVPVLLTACGGGECDEDDQKTQQPVDCKAHPEQCK